MKNKKREFTTGRVKHSIWSSVRAQNSLAHLALVAAAKIVAKSNIHENESSKKPNKLELYTPLLREVAELAEKRPDTPSYLEESGAKKLDHNLTQKFRDFLQRSSEVHTDSKLLDCLAHYLLFDDEGCFTVRNKINSDDWKKQKRIISLGFDLKQAFEDLENGEFKSLENYTRFEEPPSALITVANQYFGTTKSKFEDAALELTGRKKVSGKAAHDEKGYWACYRFSAETKGTVIKSRLVITPPEDGYDYCRFQHHLSEYELHDEDSYLRKSEGLVLPVKGRIYLIGTIGTGEATEGLKAVCLKSSMRQAEHWRSGLVMSNSVSENRDPIVGKLLLIREMVDSATENSGDGSYKTRRDDLVPFIANPDLTSGSERAVLEKFYAGTALEQRLDKVPDLKKELTDILRRIRNIPKNESDEISEAEIRKLLEVAVCI